MARRRIQGLTDREAEILVILWEAGAAPVETVRGRLTAAPSASTVRKLLQIMAQRQLVGDDGRRYGKHYHAAVDRDEVQDAALRRLVITLFDGRADSVVRRLFETGQVTRSQVGSLLDIATPPS